MNMWKNAHLVISSAAQDGVFWLPEDVMARPTVMMTVMRKTVVVKREIFGNVHPINNV